MQRVTRREMLRLASLGVLGLAASCAPRPSTSAVAVNLTPATGAPSPVRPQAPPPPSAPGPPGASALTIKPAPTAVATKPPPGRNRAFITPNHELYVQTKNAGDAPEVDPIDWRLTIDGLVDKPFSLSLDEIMALPARDEMRTLECIGNTAGGDLIGNVVWTGTPLKPLLEQAGLVAEVGELVMYAIDKYSTSVPRDVLLRDDVLLVYKMNGQSLPRDHGYPLRISIPERYGQKQPKWLTRFEAVRGPYLGYYEKQGWSNAAFIRPNAIIDFPLDFEPTPTGELTVRGVGMAGAAGIATIEVSCDDGATWQMATLHPGPSNLVWAFWEAKWTPPALGKYDILARLTDREGKGQQMGGASFSILGPSFPDGSNEIHHITALIV